MVWISAISVAIFLAVVFAAVRAFQYRKALIFALIIKVLAGINLGLIYRYHYKGGDTFVYFQEAATIARYLAEHPEKSLTILFGSEVPYELSNEMVFNNQPRAMLFSKIISVVYLGSGGNYWIISVWLSFVNFMALYYLIKELTRKYPKLEWAFISAFYFLPTFVFWTSGLLKESIAIASMGIAITIFLRIVRTSQYLNFPSWFLLISSLWLLWKLKYFYAAVLIPILIALLIFELANRHPKYRHAFGIAAVLIAVFLLSNLHYNLHYSRVLGIIYDNYLIGKSCVDCGSISYYQFDGSLLSFLINLPVAAFSGLFRPTLVEANGVWQILAALENLIVFSAVAVGIWKSRGRFYLTDPWVISLFIFVMTLATFIAFSTPNFGTLSRYKVAYWPFVVILVFALMQRAKKSQDLSDPGR